MVGVPSVYYGDELLIDGKTGFFEGARYPMPWDRIKEAGATDLRDFDETEKMDAGHRAAWRECLDLHRQLAGLRRSEKVLREGSFRFLYGADGVIAFARFDEKECLVTVLSAVDQEREIVLAVGSLGMDAASCKSALPGMREKWNCRTGEDGSLVLQVPIYGSELLRFSS